MYHIFDSVFCIHIKERTDRYEKSKELFDRLNIPVEYFFVNKHPHSGTIGCFESHINAVKKSYDRGDNYVLIFEDDIMETPNFNETVMANISEYLKATPCEYFQLGYSILYIDEWYSFITCKKHTIENTCIIDYNGLFCHSYILNRIGMKKVIDKYQTANMPIDVFYKKIMTGASVCPLLFHQNACMKSDIMNASLSSTISCLQSNLSIYYKLSFLKKHETIVWGVFMVIILYNYKMYKGKRRR